MRSRARASCGQCDPHGSVRQRAGDERLPACRLRAERGLAGNLTRLGKEDGERAFSLSQHDKRSCVDMKRHFRSTVVTTSNLLLRAVISLL
jgi:hypothetical protein